MSFACKTIIDYEGSNGAMPLLYSIRDCIPFAFQSILFCIFFILFAGSYFLVKNKTGRAKVLISLLSSSFVLVVLSSLLTLAQLVTFPTVLFFAFLSIIFFIMLLLSDNT